MMIIFLDVSTHSRSYICQYILVTWKIPDFETVLTQVIQHSSQFTIDHLHCMKVNQWTMICVYNEVSGQQKRSEALNPPSNANNSLSVVDALLSHAENE